jgi:hypothetical protein
MQAEKMGFEDEVNGVETLKIREAATDSTFFPCLD